MLEITRAVVNAVKLPVTVKTRLGWDHESRIIVDLAEQLQDCGIQALTVHGRTRSQMYTGQADWEMIARVKENPRLTIPLIGNGDITTPELAEEAFNRYGVDGVMIGRASIGAPWIFHDVTRRIKGLPDEPLTNAAKFRILRRQITESIANIDEHRGILHIRRHLAASPLFKGIPNFRETRIAMLRADTWAELDAILNHIETNILPSENN
jgi:tRNA-dihydrouridine synthase